MIEKIKEGVRNRKQAYRNPVYLVYALIGVALFLLSMIVAESGAGPVEIYLFRTFNHLSSTLEPLFHFISLFGTIGMVFIFSFVALLFRHYANALKILIGGISAYLLAYFLKTFEIRARPAQVIDGVILREDSIGTYGFPSGHAAVATVLAMVAYQFLPKRWHRPVTIMAVLVFVSRLYLGVHFPLDLVGGIAIGLICGGVVNFAFGSRKFSPVDPNTVIKKIQSLGVRATSIKLASVDARGSIPYYGVLDDGRKIFVKVVGRENNIADWLFKSWRKIVYRRLDDETPFMNSKRQLEHEAYVSTLALIGGIRTPEVIGIFETDKDRWAHAQVAINGKSLDRVSKDKITDSVLVEVWKQVEKMHTRRIVHRDLRSANVFLDDKSVPWIIDFGFAEASMPEESMERDRAELIASTAMLVGIERSVNAALKVLGKQKLAEATPFITTGVLSSATSKMIKKSEMNLTDIRSFISKKLAIKQSQPIELKRFGYKRILMIGAVGVGLFVLLPKLSVFRESLSSLTNARLHLVLFALAFSFGTYVFAAVSYRALLYFPINFKRMYLIQIACSFASKLAPGGTGGLALNARFLVKNNHTLSEATSISAINNTMGLVGHMSLLLMVVLFGATTFSEAFQIKIVLPLPVKIAILVGFLFAVFILVKSKKIRAKVHGVLKNIKKDLTYYRKHPLKLFGSYVASILITLSYTGALYASAHALGATLSPFQVLVIFTVGAATAAITPTPGGIGGAEAGLVAGLTAAGLPYDQSLAITLLYRLVTYWIPILPGFIAFQYAAKKDYI